MRFRALRPGSALVALACIAVLLPFASMASPASRGDGHVPISLPTTATDAVAQVEAEVVELTNLLRPARTDVRVALISSGVHAASLPETLRTQISHPMGGGDRHGFGTYAASVLLQIAPDAQITSLKVFGPEDVEVGRIGNALRWAANHAEDLDAVLYAVPPHSYLDPVAAAMADGSWDTVTRVIGDHPAPTEAGTVFGIALDHGIRAKQLASATAAERDVAHRFASTVGAWHTVRDRIADLEGAGVAVVAPAGDIGGNVQTIFGLAGLPEVITATGAGDGRISQLAASGPSLHGTLKPDVAAPTGIGGLLPAKSLLAAELDEAGLLVPDLELGWDAGEPLTDARARLDTTITAATLTSAAVAGLHREGVDDVAVQRGALTAAAVPLDGVPAWRQGSGVLAGLPSKAFAESRPLALSHADLGTEPDGTSWSTLVPFTHQPSSADAGLTDFAGVDPDGRTSVRDARGSGSPPLVSATSADGVRVAAPLGDGRYEGGLYCGYTDVMIPTTGADASPSVSIDGVPEGAEQVPTCLVQGTQLRAHGFYIHDMPAEDLTFSLLPHLPVGQSLIDKALMILPVNPLKTKLFTRVTDADGNAYFPNVPPGFYTVRQFSDYGSPITETLTDAATGEPVVKDRDIGENPSYQDFDALILSAAGWTEDDLRQTFGDENVTADKPTMGYMVTVGGQPIRVILGQLKKMPGPAVASRYVDLMGYEDLDFGALAVADAVNLRQLKGLPVAGDLQGWSFAPEGDGVAGAFNPLASTAKQEAAVLGIGAYPFSLTTPNYTATMSLNFSYEVSNATIVAAVVVGEEAAFGVVTPHGTVRSPTAGPFTPLGQGGVAVDTHATGLANFTFDLKPQGASEGTLFLIFVPSRPVQQVAGPLATATVDDLSFEMATWQRVLWPAHLFDDHGQGHLFSIDPNYSERQMSQPDCRPISSGGVEADVCEDWSVMVHSPGDDAATVDVEDGSGSAVAGIRSSGSTYADPQRGVADFSSALSFVMPSDGVPAEVALDLSTPFRTNGRFWEQLTLTEDVLTSHPGRLDVQITDNLRGRSNDLAPHVTGGAPVPPYVPFASEAIVVDSASVTLEDADSDGVSEVVVDLPAAPSHAPLLAPVSAVAPEAAAEPAPSTAATLPREIRTPLVRLRRR